MSDLLVTPYTPTVDRGRARRTYGVVRALAAGGPVDVLYKQFGADAPAPEYEAIANVSLHQGGASRGASRALYYAGARVRGVPRADARGLSPELAAAAATLADARGARRIIADGLAAAYMLRGLGGRHQVVLLTQNIEAALRPTLPGFRRAYGSQRALERFERAMLESAAECWMASRADVELASELAPRARLRYVPNVVDVAAIKPAASRPGLRRALFVADYGYPPNAHGLDFLLKKVMPRVWETLPDAELRLAGHRLRLSGDVDPRVVPLGFAEDLDAVYADADCAVVPLLEGGGSPLKFVEALAHGVPVVATPRAAAGLDVVPGVHFRQADGPREFADVLVEVLRDGGGELGARGRELAERSYSIEAARDMLVDQAEATR